MYSANRVFNGLADHYSNTSFIPSPLSVLEVFMFSPGDLSVIAMYVEGFLFGNMCFNLDPCYNLLKKFYYSLVEEFIPEYSPYICNAHQTSLERQTSFSMLSAFSTFSVLLRLSVIYYKSGFK